MKKGSLSCVVIWCRRIVGCPCLRHEISDRKSLSRSNLQTETICIASCPTSSVKTFPIIGLDRSLGLQEVETSRIFRRSAHEGVRVVSLTHRPPLPPREDPWYWFQLEAESTRGVIVRLEKLSMNNFSDPIGNRTRDLSVCSAVPHPTAPLRTATSSVPSRKYIPTLRIIIVPPSYIHTILCNVITGSVKGTGDLCFLRYRNQYCACVLMFLECFVCVDLKLSW